MPEIKNNFLQGKMNKDLDDRLLPNGQYRDAINIRISKTENSDAGTAQNLKGNENILNPAIAVPLASNGVDPLWEVVGYYSDSITGYVFWYVTSFNGSSSDNTNQFKAAAEITILANNITHTSGSNTFTVANSGSLNIQKGMKITEANLASDTYIETADYNSTNKTWTITMNKNAVNAIINSPVLTHTCRIYLYEKNDPSLWSGVALIDNAKLNLSRSHKITGVNLLNDLLFWTDDYNQPRRINIISAKAGEYTGTYLEDNISVAQYAPYSAPRVKMEHDTNIESEHILNEFVKFGYRLKYDNNEYSIISPFTQHCFHPGDENSSFNTGDYSISPTIDAGIVPIADQEDIYKQTTVKLMQNKANKITLLLDLPSADGVINIAAADINGDTSSASVAIDNINGSINSSNDIMVTEDGDTYHVSAYSANTVTLANAPSPVLKDNTRVYFFQGLNSTAPFSFQNNLKIKNIEIIYSESDSAAIKVIEQLSFDSTVSSTFNKIKLRAEVITSNTARLKYVYEYVYKSTKPIKTLPEQDIIRVSDVIPLKAKAQEISGNRLIYGNFLQNRSLKTAITTKNIITASAGDQSSKNKQYLLSSVKSNRTYQIGLILSDRYGRQSTVFLPDDSTVFVSPKSTNVLNGSSSWNHYSLKATFNTKIKDAYNAETNPLGWYSYRIVVKQTEQEYYNVYNPSLISHNNSSWMVLHGDNINKVPRDVTDVNPESGSQGSQTRLLPRIINTTGTKVQQPIPKFVDVISIGTALEQGVTTPASNVVMPELFNTEKNPLVAELPDGYGQTFSAGLDPDDLSVWETEPFKSALDIYYETSSAGLVSDLNAKIDANSESNRPVLLTLEDNNGGGVDSFSENQNFNTLAKIGNLKVLDEGAGDITASCSFSIRSIQDGNNTSKPGVFSIPNNTSELHITENFEHKANLEDEYTITITVSKGGVTEDLDIRVDVDNANPTVNAGADLTVPASTNSGANIRTVTGTNGSAKTSAITNGLQFSITSQTKNSNASSDFVINTNTGVISSTISPLTDTDVYALTITVTDAGNATATDSFTITVGAANYNTLYVSSNNYINNSDPDDYGTIGSEPAGVKKWHDGANTYPAMGDIVFSDTSGSTVWNSNGYWHSMSAPNPASNNQALFVVKTNSSGAVVGVWLVN
jgi:hypothetical protein